MVKVVCIYCGKIRYITEKQKREGRGILCGSKACKEKHRLSKLSECVICGAKYKRSEQQKKYKHICRKCIPIQKEINRLIKLKEKTCPACGQKLPVKKVDNAGI